MKLFILRILVGVSVSVLIALLMKWLGFSEFSQGLWAGTFGNLAQNSLAIIYEN